MAGERGGLWFVTEVETAETVEVAHGSRSAEDVGGGFGSSVVQQTRKSLTQRVQIDAEDLKREIAILLAVVSDVFDQAPAETGLSLISPSRRSRSARRGRSASSAAAARIGGSGGIRLSFKRQRPAG